MEFTGYIPALMYHWLTKLYDLILQMTMPERKIKSLLLAHDNIMAGQANKPQEIVL